MMISVPNKITFSFSVILLCLTLSKVSQAQFTSNSYQSIVVDEKLEPIAGAYIKNMRSNKFTTTNSNGTFSIQCRNEDSLLITTMGYELLKVYVKEGNVAYIQLRPLLYTLEQVNVYDFKGWKAFKEEFLETEIPGEKINITGLPQGIPSQKPIPLRSHTFETRPTALHWIVRPFSSIAYYANDDEKSKRAVWEMMNLENKEMAYWKVMNSDSIQSWVSIPDSTIQEFIFFCNQKIDDKGLGATYYYKEKIIDLYPVFLSEKQGRK